MKLATPLISALLAFASIASASTSFDSLADGAPIADHSDAPPTHPDLLENLPDDSESPPTDPTRRSVLSVLRSSATANPVAFSEDIRALANGRARPWYSELPADIKVLLPILYPVATTGVVKAHSATPSVVADGKGMESESASAANAATGTDTASVLSLVSTPPSIFATPSVATELKGMENASASAANAVTDTSSVLSLVSTPPSILPASSALNASSVSNSSSMVTGTGVFNATSVVFSTVAPSLNHTATGNSSAPMTVTRFTTISGSTSIQTTSEVPHATHTQSMSKPKPTGGSSQVDTSFHLAGFMLAVLSVVFCLLG
ncbi:hypothetical protein BDV95DRAFT_103281 [Massariosphaeria phaeospora]|uniref:GPI anchored protein n=1 Tax=Massariosphaeria phaeospora TaxID=100035 RepID=A0A7C8IAX3_9PLEO|nr:hypothetical protein BDV95DRAFT_103281 [Massariosphaeria phaeospora]